MQIRGLAFTYLKRKKKIRKRAQTISSLTQKKKFKF